MASITLTDQHGATLFDIGLLPGQGLGRYLDGIAVVRAIEPMAALLDSPITDVGRTRRELALAFDRDVGLGEHTLSITAGAEAAVSIHPGGAFLFASDDLLAPLPVAHGTTTLGVELGAQVTAGLAGEQGRLGFGFTAGTGIRVAYYHPFDTASDAPSLRDALETGMRHVVLPNDVDDLVSLPVGAHASVRGDGAITIEGTATLAASANPLVSPSLPVVGAVAVTVGATADVGAAFRLEGGYEVRVSKLDQRRVQLAFHRRSGRDLSVSAAIRAGGGVTLGDRELVSLLIGALRSDPEVDLLDLVTAELSDAEIEAIAAAVEASIDRSLQISAQVEVAAVRRDRALFAYELTLDALNPAGREAVAEALRGRLTALERVADAGEPGVRLLTSGRERLLQRRAIWKLNVFGIVNFASLHELVRHSLYSHDPVSGTLNITDHVTASRIGVLSTPLADAHKLRRVVFQSMVATAAYRASRLLQGEVALAVSHTFVEQHGRTDRTEMANHFRAIQGLGLCDATEAAERLADISRFGTSTFMLEATLDESACDALFLDADGRPYDQQHYERVGRNALLALLPEEDPTRSFRRGPLQIESLWAKLRVLPNFQTTLPQSLASRAGIIRDDVLTVLFWATAMQRAAVALAEVRQILNGRRVDALVGNEQFMRARTRLERALAEVAETTEAQFNEPWEVLALDEAASRLGRLRAVIVSPVVSAAYEDDEHVVPAPRAARAPVRARSRALDSETPTWTPEQQEVFERHVVNLRRGAFSDDGTFRSSVAQVRRIFEERIPEAIAARSRPDRPLPVVFYAHGGLIEEVEGLRAVIARHRFWLLNGIYPVFFVWETGLLDSLRDELDAVVPFRGIGTRSLVTDPALERIARPGGRLIWDRMKRSAALAFSGHGAGKQVVTLARALGERHPEEVRFHAVGHSAGTVFHAHFLPHLTAGRGRGAVSVQTLHFLAPAITTALFTQNLLPLIGVGNPVTALTMYTMREELEKADPTTRPYGKSLLYLVSAAFEAETSTPILGLEESLKRDLSLIRFFGLAGREKVADVLFSETPAASPRRSGTRSRTHGDFDNDGPTMNSVVRRILDAPETDEVVEFFQDPVELLTAPGREGDDQARAVGPAAVRTSRPKPWTILIWMAGDNGIEGFGARDLTALRTIGSTEAFDVVVQFDRMHDSVTRRYHLRAGADGRDGDIVEVLGETAAGDPEMAADFFEWGIRRFPSTHVLAVFWNHGVGIGEADVDIGNARLGTLSAGQAAPSTVSRAVLRTALARGYGQALFRSSIEAALRDGALASNGASRLFLDALALKRVLGHLARHGGRRIDVVGFDGSLPSTIELAYQVRGASDWIVGSDATESDDGWAYDRVLAALHADPDASPRRVGAMAVDRHAVARRREGGRLLLDLDHLDAAAEAVDALAASLIGAIRTAREHLAVMKALGAATDVGVPDVVDLAGFCRALHARTRVAAVRKAAREVIDTVAGTSGLVSQPRQNRAARRGASGLAIYFPRARSEASMKTYRRLDFAKATRWGRFLDAYHRA